MSRSTQLTLRLIDIAGTCAVAACALGFFWATLVRGDQTANEVKGLESLVRVARRDTLAARDFRDRQRAALAERQAALAKRGHLPEEVPIEQYFQALSTIASKHRLRVIRYNPLSPRQYPGLVEQRYAYEVNGSFPDLLGFLRSIEGTDFWADVSYLKVERGRGPEVSAANERTALLTISLFAALPEDLESEGDGA